MFRALSATTGRKVSARAYKHGDLIGRRITELGHVQLENGSFPKTMTHRTRRPVESTISTRGQSYVVLSVAFLEEDLGECGCEVCLFCWQRLLFSHRPDNITGNGDGALK